MNVNELNQQLARNFFYQDAHLYMSEEDLEKSVNHCKKLAVEVSTSVMEEIKKPEAEIFIDLCRQYIRKEDLYIDKKVEKMAKDCLKMAKTAVAAFGYIPEECTHEHLTKEDVIEIIKNQQPKRRTTKTRK